MGIVETLTNWTGSISGFLWSAPLAFTLLGAGLIISVTLKFVQFRGFKHGIELISGKYDKPEHEGAITHFQALSAALSATIGTGNIVGVAEAIYWGGPGAIFWMWLTALFGMAIKFTSCTLAQKFRKIDPDGYVRGGPMYYIEMGLGPKFKFLAIIFAVFTALAAFGTGNMAQANSVSNALSGLVYGNLVDASDFWFKLIVGIVLAFLIGLVIIGGIKRIGQVASRIVPLMSVFYVTGSLIIIFMHLDMAAAAIQLIFKSAFRPDAVTGGMAGSAFIIVLRHGVARGIFSNESGLGTAPMAHAAAKTDKPVREGLVAMLGPFIDTIVICSMTAVIIIMTRDWTVVHGPELTSYAFNSFIPHWGHVIVSIGLAFFAFSTVISWSYYGEKGFEYLFGREKRLIYRWIFLMFIPLGASIKIKLVWNLCDIGNALMALPNLIALLLLLPLIHRLSRDYFKEYKGYKKQR
ncbi:MAG TPA: sodium:alanine symporter family protein [candidate division Zixibacteria bacterium]|nr:sodium:alanine symporter family protein [candidate division Zixibacteria bacterium]